MIITIVSDVLGEENNGTTIATMNLARYLIQRGDEVRFLCADQSKLGIENYYVVKNLNVGPFNGYVRKNGVSLAKPEKDIILKSFENTDLVYIMIPLLLGFKAAKLAHERNIPIIAGFHMQAQNLSSHFHLQNIKLFNKLVYKIIYKHVYRYTSAIHFPTKFIKDEFESAIKKKTNGYVISNGINNYVVKKDIEKLDEFKDKIVILSTGRYSREKNQQLLIKAIYKSKYKDDIQLILAGKGPLMKKYEHLGRNLKNKPILKFYKRDEIIDILNMADIYVHPALMELEGISCLEAICVGKLVIVSDSKESATKNFAVSEKCIYKHNSKLDLAKKIDYFIENKDEAKEIEKLYLNSAINFNQTETLKQMGNMIDDIVKGKN